MYFFRLIIVYADEDIVKDVLLPLKIGEQFHPFTKIALKILIKLEMH